MTNFEYRLMKVKRYIKTLYCKVFHPRKFKSWTWPSVGKTYDFPIYCYKCGCYYEISRPKGWDSPWRKDNSENMRKLNEVNERERKEAVGVLEKACENDPSIREFVVEKLGIKL